MNFRLRTTLDAKAKLKKLHSSTGLTPNILSRIAIALSLLEDNEPEYIKPDPNGLEFNRPTLTGDHDIVYKSLIKQYSQSNISEREYFPDVFNAHLHRGVNLLYQMYKYTGNYNRFLDSLLEVCFESFESVEEN